MLRLTAYILMSVMLINCNPGLQLVKLPKLFEHYSEHSQRDPDLSFMDFLSMHYWGQDLNDKDDKKDRQLPFKGKVAASFHCDVLFGFPQLTLKSPFEHLHVVHDAAYTEAVIAMDTASLFRPPQEIRKPTGDFS